MFIFIIFVNVIQVDMIVYTFESEIKIERFIFNLIVQGEEYKQMIYSSP